ncbi:MAG: apolipoprotein N-acyltransferase [Candidatus Kapabacteria bacterium]|nr:apolipoprotein N-acyltransferase [Candidatus Kapabacteria bacterium]
MQTFLQRPVIRALLSGVLLGIAFPQVSLGTLGLLVFVAYVPLLLAIIDGGKAARRWSLIAWFYLTFVVFHGLSNWWVCSWQAQTDPYLFASGLALWLFHPFFLMLPFIALASIRRRLGIVWMLISTPLSIAGFEWLHGQTDASYPWLTIGYSLVHTPFAQVADTVGVYGLSFMIGIVNALVLYVFLALRQGARIRTPSVLLAVFIIAWGAWGLSKSEPPINGDSISVMLVQPNENPWEKWGDTRAQVDVHEMLVDSARSSGSKPDMVVWSETAIPYTIRDPRLEAEWEELRKWVDTSQISLLTGFADVMVYPPGQAPPSARHSRIDPAVRFDTFNAAMMINAGVLDVPVHRKSMLTPFAERLPFADQLTFAMSWIEWGVGISAWGKGQTRNPLELVRSGDTIAHVGTIICIESIYPEVARDLFNNGASTMVQTFCALSPMMRGTTAPGDLSNISILPACEPLNRGGQSLDAQTPGSLASSDRTGPRIRIPLSSQ